MKMFKIISLTVLFVVALTFSVTSTSMAQDCANATVKLAGPSYDKTAIAFHCNDANTTFPDYVQRYVREDSEDQALAVAISAISTDKRVWIRVLNDKIQVIYLRR